MDLYLFVGYIEGTKIEFAYNRYTFVWRGSVEKNKTKPEDKIHQVLSLVEKHIGENKKTEELGESPKPIDREIPGSKVKELNSGLDKT